MSKAEFEFDLPATLPDGWKWMPLEDLMDQPMQDIVDGPFGSNLKASEYVEKGIPIARLQNVDRNIFVHKNIKYVTRQKAEELSRHTFVPGDILITKLGDPLGEACIAPSSIEHGVIVADLVRVRPAESKVDRHYLTYAINSPLVARQFERHTKGTTRPRVNLGMIRKLPIPVAPREMQAGVVAEIEKQVSRLDDAVSNLKRVKANLKRYKAAVLKAAVEGRLVETEAERARREGHSFESGAQLLQRILETRRSQWQGKGKYKEPAAPDTTDLPELPEGWVWASLDAISTIIDSLHKTPSYTERGYPMVRVTEVRGGLLDLSGALCVAEEVFAEFTRRYKPTRGDIVLSRVGSYGNASLVCGDQSFCLGQNTAIIGEAAIEPSFLHMCLESSVIKRQIDRAVVGSSQKTWSLKHISQLSIPIPSISEQQRIVAEVGRRLSIAEGAVVQIDANLKRAQTLRGSVLSNAFRNEQF